MANWKHTVKIKHLFVEDEDHESVIESMSQVADVLEKSRLFKDFTSLDNFRKIPEGDDVFGPIEYANIFLSRMYDYADCNRIWIE